MGKTAKVVVFGMKGVGKTTILEQAIHGSVNKDTCSPTIEDIYCASVETERGSRERVRFYDSGGSRDCMSPHFPLADGFLFVFDPSRPDSLDWLIQIKREVDKTREKKEAVFVLLSNFCGNAADPVAVAKAETWSARERVKMYEVNALERATLNQPLVWMTSKMIQPQTKSSFPQLGMRKRD